MADKSYKAFERRVARRLGGRRLASTGEKAGVDVVVEGFSVIQCKLGRRMPAYLEDWLAGIRVAAKDRWAGYVPLVVWKPKGTDDAGALVILRLDDWAEMHGADPSGLGRPLGALDATRPRPPQ